MACLTLEVSSVIMGYTNHPNMTERFERQSTKEITHQVIEQIMIELRNGGYPDSWAMYSLEYLKHGRLPTDEEIGEYFDVHDETPAVFIGSILYSLASKGFKLPNSLEYDETRIDDAVKNFSTRVKHRLN